MQRRASPRTLAGLRPTTRSDPVPHALSPSGFSRQGDDEDHKLRLGSWRAYVRSYAWVRPLCLLTGIFAAALSLLLLLYWQLPSLDALGLEVGTEGQPAELRLAVPRSFDDLRDVRRTLAVYRERHPVELTAFLLAAEIFMLAFMIPGSIAISVLAGSLYSFPTAVLFSTAGSTFGLGANYLLLRLTLKDAIWAAFPGRLATFAREVRRHHAHLLYYMLFLRVTPLFPAWFINIAAPLLEVPLLTVFLPATAIGHQPINILTAQAGRTLNSLHSLHDFYSPTNVVFLLFVGVLALAPVAFRKGRPAAAAQSKLPGAAPSTLSQHR